MIALVRVFIGALLTICESVVGRVLLALGMGYVTYSGFDLTISWLLNQIKSDISAMPAQVVAFLAYLWIDKAIGMVFSAYSAALLIKLGGSNKLTKLVTKG